MARGIELRSLSVEDYHRMTAAGILDADERVELIEGQLYRMAAKGTAHSAAMTRIGRVLSRSLSGRALLRWQDPVRLSEVSEPEPDVAVVKLDPTDYEARHPTPEEIYGLIEVADTTLQRDLRLKAPAYGRAWVRECWVLDVQARCLYVFREPGEEGYAREWVLGEGETIRPLSFPDCAIAIADFLRSPLPNQS